MAAQPRDDLHQLINELAESDVPTVRRMLRALAGAQAPALRPHSLGQLLDEAPEEDEELTPEELAHLKEGEEAWRRGEVISLDDLSRELGLS